MLIQAPSAPTDADVPLTLALASPYSLIVVTTPVFLHVILVLPLFPKNITVVVILIVEIIVIVVEAIPPPLIVRSFAATA